MSNVVKGSAYLLIRGKAIIIALLISSILIAGCTVASPSDKPDYFKNVYHQYIGDGVGCDIDVITNCDYGYVVVYVDGGYDGGISVITDPNIVCKYCNNTIKYSEDQHNIVE